MSVRGLLLPLVAVLAVAFFVMPAVADEDELPVVKLTAGDKDSGGFVVEVPSGPVDMMVVFALYDAQNGRMVRSKRPHGSLHAGWNYKIVEPGTYVFVNYVQQGHWGMCFQANSVAFEVRPGEVTALGVLDLTPQLAVLAKKVTESGHTKARAAEIFQYFDDVPPPLLVNPLGSDATVQETQDFVRKSQPEDTPPVHIAEFSPAHFVNRTNLWGTPVCGWIP